MSGTPPGTLALDVASCTEPGQRDGNEDALAHGCHGTRWFAVLSDGAGGHLGGALASARVVRSAQQEFQRGDAWGAAALRAVVAACNDAVNRDQPALQGRDRMHATVVALWIDLARQQVHWAHVGDSRLYRVRQGRATLLTRDDSVMQRLVDAGLLSADEARQHPARGQLMAALGSRSPLDIHVNEPAAALRDGDAYLLCSDGWWEAFDSGDLEGSHAQAGSAAQWLQRMAQQVCSRDLAWQDNYSAIAVWVGGGGRGDGG